ncbi:MAG: crotonase/enoyl-CoA hydratase family protein [Cohaesibacter sp.]|nr:crotonase/enoyl-CoA hydratase family protein [Cohaesibacter sp.]
MCENVSVEIRDGIQTIRMSRAEKKNAITIPMYEAIAAALTQANEQDDIRVSVLLGVPGAFSSGNDIKDFTKMAMGGGLGEPIVDFLTILANTKKPLLAGVDGLAIGVGTTMLFHCDYVVASDRSLFKTPFTDLALVPEAASTLLAPLVMGHQKAFELLCMSEGFDAAAFEKMGVINKVTSTDKLEDSILEAAKTIAAKPTGAMQLSKALMKQEGREAIEERIRKEAMAFATQLTSKEAQAAFMAFLGKRS